MCARKDVEKGLSFDSVQKKDTGISIDETVELSLPILTDPAEAPIPVKDVTLPGAEITLDFPSTQRGEIRGEFGLDEAFRRHGGP